MMTHRFLLSLLLISAAACSEPAVETASEPEAAAPEAPADEMAANVAVPEVDPAEAALAAAVASDLRSADNKARDEFRNPAETIAFFGVEPGDTVVEIWPGGGWYTEILAPYVTAGGGTYYAAHFHPDGPFGQSSLARFTENFVGAPEVYGPIELTGLSAENVDIAPAGSADYVLTFRNVHNFQMGEWAPAAFAAFYEALKPGGVLGVVDHRLPEQADDAAEQRSGYVKVSTVRRLAEEAGFVFDGESEVNANPNDDADHPFGVWTLRPSSRTADRNGEAPEGFDPEEYLAIGESDRMTLRFKKPEAEPTEALLE
ncbi:MAG: hypothetical protein AAGI89_05540 [Pseudomonadota bacterium]